jgi:hypothetical protein
MTLLTRLTFLQLTWLWYHSVTPNFKAKLNAYSMCDQESSLHTYRTENRYIITNVTIYNICYRIMSYKRLSRTLSKTLQRKDIITSHVDNQCQSLTQNTILKYSKSSSAFEQQVWVAGENSKVEYTYGWYSTSAGINGMHGIITR